MNIERSASGNDSLRVTAIDKHDDAVCVHRSKKSVNVDTAETWLFWLRVRQTKPAGTVSRDFAVTAQVQKK
jgi:hypothetical protein